MTIMTHVYRLLWYDTVSSGRNLPTVLGDLLFPSSGWVMEETRCCETSINVYQYARRNILEETMFQKFTILNNPPKLHNCVEQISASNANCRIATPYTTHLSW